MKRLGFRPFRDWKMEVKEGPSSGRVPERDGIEMIAPHRSNRQKPATEDGRRFRRYARRWLVERFFARIQCPRVFSSDGSITRKTSSAACTHAEVASLLPAQADALLDWCERAGFNSRPVARGLASGLC